MTDIQDFPDLIAQSELTILRKERLLEIDKKTLRDANAEARANVAFDPEMTNDAQRDVRFRQIVRGNAWYEEVSERAQETTREIRKQEIELTRLKGEFEVAKLLFREKLAILGGQS